MSDSINTQMIDELKELMEDDFSVLLETYITDSDERIDALQSAIIDNESEQVRELAHAFKGSSANLGASQLSELCYSLENMGRDAKLDEAPAAMDEVKAEYQHVREYFKGLL